MAPIEDGEFLNSVERWLARFMEGGDANFQDNCNLIFAYLEMINPGLGSFLFPRGFTPTGRYQPSSRVGHIYHPLEQSFLSRLNELDEREGKITGVPSRLNHTLRRHGHLFYRWIGGLAGFWELKRPSN